VFFGASAEGRADELRHEFAATTDYPIERVWWLPEKELIRWLSEKARGADWRQGRMDTLVALIHDEVRIEGGEWPWEALTHFELYPDTCVVGGLLVRPTDRLILSAGQYLGFGRGCETPDRGTALGSFGHFGQLRKQHSVSAVTSRFCVVDESFLRSATLGRHSKTLGAWLGASAKRAGRRVVYSPFLHGWTAEDWEESVSDQAIRDFVTANHDLVPEVGMLSPHLGLTASRRYLPVGPEERRRQIRRLIE